MTKKRSLVSLPLFVLLVLVVMFEQEQQRNNNIVMVVDAFQPATTTRTRGAHHPNRSTTTTTVGSRMMRFFVRRFPGSTLQMTATADTTTTRNRPQLDDNNYWIPAGRSSDINDDDLMMPQLGDDGLYHILTKEQHVTLLQRFPHHIIVFKYYSPWCRACKAMESKYTKIIREMRNNNIDNNNFKQQKQLLPIIWADMTFKGNREYFESIDVKALPTIQFYIGNTVFDTFGCAPEKIPLFKTKLNAFINEHVDTTTNRLKESSIEIAKKEMMNVPAAVPQTMKAERRSTATTTTVRRTSTPSRGSTTFDHHVVDQDQLLDELVARLQEAARQAQMRRKGNNSSSGGSTTTTTTTSPLATP